MFQRSRELVLKPCHPNLVNVDRRAGCRFGRRALVVPVTFAGRVRLAVRLGIAAETVQRDRLFVRVGRIDLHGRLGWLACGEQVAGSGGNSILAGLRAFRCAARRRYGTRPYSSSQLCLASPQLRPNFRSTRIGTVELHGLAAEPRHHLALLARRHRAFRARRASAAAARCPRASRRSIHSLVWHRGRALDQRIQRRVGVGATQLLAVPGMLGIGDAAAAPLRASTGRHPWPSTRHLVLIPVPARAVVQLGVAVALGHRSGRCAESFDTNGSLRVVLRHDRLRLRQRLADHLGELAHAGAVDLGEVDGLRRVCARARSCRRPLRESRRRDRCDRRSAASRAPGRSCCTA